MNTEVLTEFNPGDNYNSGEWSLAFSLAVDCSGNPFVCGIGSGPTFGTLAYLRKLDSSGVAIWTSVLEGDVRFIFRPRWKYLRFWCFVWIARPSV